MQAYLAFAFPREPNVKDKVAELRRRLAHARADVLTMTSEDVSSLMARFVHPAVVSRCTLYAIPPSTMPGRTPPYGDPEDLVRIVEATAGRDVIVFLPDLTFRDDWFGETDGICLRGVVKWQEEAPSPYPHVRMRYDGSDVDARRRGVAGMPLELRWWLTRLDILDDEGCNLLRPVCIERPGR